MNKIILARLVTGQLVIAEKTEYGIKNPLILIVAQDGSGAYVMDFFGGLSKNGKVDSEKVHIMQKDILGLPVDVEPIEEMANKYIERVTGITVPKKKIVGPNTN